MTLFLSRWLWAILGDLIAFQLRRRLLQWTLKRGAEKPLTVPTFSPAAKDQDQGSILICSESTQFDRPETSCSETWDISASYSSFELGSPSWYEAGSRFSSCGESSCSLDTPQQSKRCEDAIASIRRITNRRLQTYLQHLCCFMLSLVLGVLASWKLALAMLIFLSIIVLLSKLILAGASRWTANTGNAYLSASLVLEETLDAPFLHMIVANGCQEYEVLRYQSALKRAVRVANRAGHLFGLSAGALYLALYGSFAFAFWYGSVLLLGKGVSAGTVVHVFYLSVVGAFSLSKLVPLDFVWYSKHWKQARIIHYVGNANVRY